MDADTPTDESRELERLRTENARLRSQLTGREVPSSTDRSARRRRWLSIALAVVGALTLPAAVLTVWVRDTLLDTDQYVTTVAPLARDEAVREAVSFQVAEAAAEALDVESIVEDVLPPEASVLAGPIDSATRSLIQDAASSLLASPEFATLWEEAHRAGHETLVPLLTGEGDDLVDTRDGRVVVDLGVVVDEVLVAVSDQFGIDVAELRGEAPEAELVVVESSELADAQTLVGWIDAMSWLWLVIVVVMFAGAVLVAEDRRLGVRRVGLAVVIPMVATLLLYGWAREQYLAEVSDQVRSPAAFAAFFDVLTRFLARSARAVLAVGVVLIGGAWVVGPSGSAARVRSWWRAAVSRAGESASGREVGALPHYVAAHENQVGIGVAIVGATLAVVWPQPTGLVVIGLTVLTLSAVGIVRVVAAIGRRTDVAAAPPDPSTP